MAECCAHAAELQALHTRLEALTQSLADRLPPEPLYSLPQAALLLYCAPKTLAGLLAQHRAALSPPRYRWDRQHRSHRMLTNSDLMLLRSKLLRPSISRRLTTTQREVLASTG